MNLIMTQAILATAKNTRKTKQSATNKIWKNFHKIAKDHDFTQSYAGLT